MAHSHYIIIAYINDGHHAGSIFIYYSVVICIGYAICWAGFHPQKCLKPKSKQSNKDSNGIGIAVLAGFAFAVYLGIVVTTTVYFVLIPINKSISDVPDRLAGIYMSGAFAIVAFVLFRMINFFYRSRKPHGIEKAIIKQATSLKTSNEEWNTKTDDEKVDELYEVVVHIISSNYKKTLEVVDEGINTGNERRNTY